MRLRTIPAEHTDTKHMSGSIARDNARSFTVQTSLNTHPLTEKRNSCTPSPALLHVRQQVARLLLHRERKNKAEEGCMTPAEELKEGLARWSPRGACLLMHCGRHHVALISRLFELGPVSEKSDRVFVVHPQTRESIRNRWSSATYAIRGP